MTRRDRAWLRSFVHLGARAALDGVTPSDVERQEDTVLRALELLRQQPGVMLADEVGMGKTYEALGVMAAMRHEQPDARVLILTPGPDLNAKWKQELDRFSDPEHPIFDFGRDVAAVTKLVDLAVAATRARIVVAPVSAFTSTRGGEDQAYLLSLFVYWLRRCDYAVDGRTVNAIMSRFRKGRLLRVDVRDERFLDLFSFEQVEPKLGGVFRAQAGGSGSDDEDDEKTPGLFELYKQQGLAAFADDEWRVRRALDLARFRLLRKLIKPFDLLVVDEAHKLKNATTVRYQAVTALLTRRFDKALFLTATPFQLDVAELTQVFRLFSLAREAPQDLMERAGQLLDDVRAYQDAYTAFEAVWRRLDAGAADRFRQLYARDPEVADCPDDPILDTVARRLAALRQLKRTHVEPSFQRWMIRSIRRDRRAYRRHQPTRLTPTGPQALPFLLGERLIAELFRTGDGTHKPAAQVSLVSSFGAARRGALLGDGARPMAAEANAYRLLLRRVLQDVQRNGDHPKLTAVLRDALDHAERGDKTLVFCARLETLSELAGEIRAAWLERMLERWKAVFPRARRDEFFDEAPATDGGTRAKGRHTLLQARFHRAQDALYLALREPYLRSALDIADWTTAHAAAVARDAEEALSKLRVGRTSAERHDYRLMKRCVEQAAARRWAAAVTHLERDRAPVELLDALADARYVQAGLDLERGGAGAAVEDDPEPGTLRVRWRITAVDVRLVVGSSKSLWARLRPELGRLDRRARVALVEQVARFLTFKEVGFLVDLLSAAKAAKLPVDPVESKPLLSLLDEFWDTPKGGEWLARLSGFVRYFVSRDPVQRQHILKGPIRTGDVVRQTKDGESRERLREAFNTPLYPMILLANEVMQEGLDLHRHCRRVVHYDLAWNPAQLEQRVGRVDRIGSWIAQLREHDPAQMLDVLYPLIDRTIDVRMYRRVKQREKWLEFLLGAAPTFREDLLEDEDVPELPPGLAESLAIDLGPPRSA